MFLPSLQLFQRRWQSSSSWRRWSSQTVAAKKVTVPSQDTPPVAAEKPKSYKDSPEWKEYERKVKEICTQYRKETAQVPTKAQILEQKKLTGKTKRDTEWQKYLDELRPKVAAMPYGTASIRASLRNLDRKPPPIVRTEEERKRRVENFIKARREVVLERRRRVLQWAQEMKVIEPKDFEKAIRAAWANPTERNQSIEQLVQQQIERSERIRKIVPHADALEESILLKPHVVQP